jgi:predicted nucleotidyltransferase
VRDVILEKLAEIEQGENIQIVYACESGSRAWGFPSADSDYDVRFIYLRSLDWYLSVFEQRDVIEKPISDRLDINGWDLKKALGLLAKSNPPLLEWLGSPIVYQEKTFVAPKMRKLAEAFYSPTACAYHYLHMAKGNFRAYLQGDEIWVKKYFYVLRPVLAILWIEQGLGIVPTDFTIMVDRLVADPETKAAIVQLLAEKRTGAELKTGPRIEPISRFIETHLKRWSDGQFHYDKSKLPYDLLDNLLRRSVKELW